MGTGVVGPNVGSAAVGVPRGTTVAARWGPTVGTRAAVLTTGSGPVPTEVSVASNSCSKVATAVGTTTSSGVGDGIGDVVGASITTGAVVTTAIASCCVAFKPGPEDTSALWCAAPLHQMQWCAQPRLRSSRRRILPDADLGTSSMNSTNRILL